MPEQHANLARSISWFLSPSPSSPTSAEHTPQNQALDISNGIAGPGIAIVVAGFHTGRGIVASFFEAAVAEGLVVEKIYERDINAVGELGRVTREWMPVREGEGVENRARWNIVAFLRRAACMT